MVYRNGPEQWKEWRRHIEKRRLTPFLFSFRLALLLQYSPMCWRSTCCLICKPHRTRSRWLGCCGINMNALNDWRSLLVNHNEITNWIWSLNWVSFSFLLILRSNKRPSSKRQNCYNPQSPTIIIYCRKGCHANNTPVNDDDAFFGGRLVVRSIYICSQQQSYTLW